MPNNKSRRVSALNILIQVMKQLPRAHIKLKGVYKLIVTKPTQKYSIGLLLAEQAKKRPNNLAIKFEDKTYTYREVNDRANKVANYLLAQNIKPGEAVAVLMDNRPETLINILGIVKVGAIASMINTSQRGEVLHHSLTLVEAKLIIVGEELLDNLSTAVDTLPETMIKSIHAVKDPHTKRDVDPSVKNYIDFDKAISDQSTANPAITATIQLKQPAFYIFTSGTTGMPKASVMTHYRWYKSTAGMGLASLTMKDNDVFYMSLPLYHNNALTVSLGSVLSSGACMALAKKFSVSGFWDDIRKTESTVFCYIGELCRYLLSAPPKANDKQHKLRVCIGNGLRPDIWTEFKERFNIPHINEFYGASECNLVFTNTFNLDKTAGWTPMPYEVVAYNVEEDKPEFDSNNRMISVKAGDVGLLITKVTERQPFEGYTDEGATNKKLLRNAFKDGDCWFNTGDLVVNQGLSHIAFSDRLGDTFRWKGENVATTEVESVLMEHPAIEHAVVYGVQIPHTDGRAGMATITLNPEHTDPDWESITKHMRETLPAYEIPVFLRLREQQEVTGTFKYRKVELKEEAYHLDKVEDEDILVLIGKKNPYQPLTKEIEAQIDKGEISL